MTRMADIQVTTNFDIGDLQRRLLDAERDVMTKHEDGILRHIKDTWTGWKYAGRPATAPINVSMKAWKTRIQTTEQPAQLIIENHARSWDGGEPYVANIKRRLRNKRTEAELLFEDLVRHWFPPLLDDLKETIAKTVAQPANPRRLNRRTGPDDLIIREIEI